MYLGAEHAPPYQIFYWAGLKISLNTEVFLEIIHNLCIEGQQFVGFQNERRQRGLVILR